VEYVGSIVVEDASGARFHIHEYKVRRFFKLTRRFVLETGAPVKRIDLDNYVVEKTGEPLVRVP
jgi:hypothetical protein